MRTLRARPILALLPRSPEPRCRLVLGVGVCWGERGAPEPSSQAALWLIRHRFLARRTYEGDGSLKEHWQLSAYCLELEIGLKLYRLRLMPHRWPSFEVAAANP